MKFGNFILFDSIPKTKYSISSTIVVGANREQLHRIVLLTYVVLQL